MAMRNNRFRQWWGDFAAAATMAWLSGACSSTRWLDEPVTYPIAETASVRPESSTALDPVSSPPDDGKPGLYGELEGRTIREPTAVSHSAPPLPGLAPTYTGQGRPLGSFRNTYYDFPAERDFAGSLLMVHDSHCRPIQEVPRNFFEALCVQGSGTLRDGSTVSFARRECECAEICPRTQQRICFDRLEPTQFPWGRGATGKPITPLLTVAVDTEVIPLGASLYIPEFEGIARDLEGSSVHDGCFIAQDRGLLVKGQQVDVFTGHPSVTRLWNQRVPSNRGVHVFIDEPKCARGPLPAEVAEGEPASPIRPAPQRRRLGNKGTTR